MKILVDSRFWNARSSFDKEELFADATLLWEAACGYFDWCDNNPLIERITGKDGKQIEKEYVRAFSIQGLCGYLDCSHAYYETFKRRCTDDDVLDVISRIEDATVRSSKLPLRGY